MRIRRWCMQDCVFNVFVGYSHFENKGSNTTAQW